MCHHPSKEHKPRTLYTISGLGNAWNPFMDHRLLIPAVGTEEYQNKEVCYLVLEIIGNN